MPRCSGSPHTPNEFGADGSRIAVAGNSVGGDMTAALTLMTKDRTGPKISYQVLFIPATDASVDSASYHAIRHRPLPCAKLHEVRLGPLRSRRQVSRQPVCVAAAGDHRPN